MSAGQDLAKKYTLLPKDKPFPLPAMKNMKAHPSLYPLSAVLAFAVGIAGLYTLRLATVNPDVSWFRTSNPEPWTKLGPNQQHNFYHGSIDYKKLPKPERPQF